MPIVIGGLSPHPPVILPEIGGGYLEEVQDTVNGLTELAALVRSTEPEVLIIVSPHGPVLHDAVAVTTLTPLKGDFGSFGYLDLSLQADNFPLLAESILAEARRRKIPVVDINIGAGSAHPMAHRLDHGTMVPLLYFRRSGLKCPVIPIAPGLIPFDRLFEFGGAVRAAVSEWGGKAAVIASGDLSHRLTRDAPAGFDPEGQVFDRKIVEILQKGDLKSLLGFPLALADRAGECGLRPLVILAGALEGEDLEPRIFSYEGPFGVGYATAVFVPKEGLETATGREQAVLTSREEGSPRGASDPAELEEDMVAERRGEPYLIRLARQSLETFVREGRVISPSRLPGEFRRRAGVFVSLKKGGRLRGCIGTVEPLRDNVCVEVIYNSISAGTNDPRFDPVRPDELEEIRYSVDILGPPEKVVDLRQLDAERYGIIVRKDYRTGLLLPNLEGITSPEDQLFLAKQKAGIDPFDHDVEIERFEVTRYTEGWVPGEDSAP